MFAAHSDEWIDVLPDDFLGGRNLKNAAGCALANKSVAVGQSLRAADVVTEK